MIKLLGRCWAGCVMRVTYYYSFTKFLGTILHQGFVPPPAPARRFIPGPQDTGGLVLVTIRHQLYPCIPSDDFRGKYF